MKITPKWVGTPALTIELTPEDAATFASIVRNCRVGYGLALGGASKSFIERGTRLIAKMDAMLVEAGVLR